MRAEQSRNALIDYLSTGVAESWAFEDLLLLGKRRSEITGKVSPGRLPSGRQTFPYRIMEGLPVTSQLGLRLTYGVGVRSSNHRRGHSGLLPICIKVVDNNRGLFRLDYWPGLGVDDASRDSI